MVGHQPFTLFQFYQPVYGKHFYTGIRSIFYASDKVLAIYVSLNTISVAVDNKELKIDICPRIVVLTTNWYTYEIECACGKEINLIAYHVEDDKDHLFEIILEILW